MYAEVSKVLARPDVAAKFAAEGSIGASGRSTQQFAKLVRSEHRVWGEVVRQGKIQIE